MEHTEKYFIGMLDAEKVETFAEGVKQSIIRAVNKIEKPLDIGRNKVDLTTLKTSCSYDPMCNYIVIAVTANSRTEPLSYSELMRNYLNLKRQIAKDDEYDGT